MSSTKRVLSGIQPTAGSFHLGNYLGALRNWVRLQDEAEALFMVVDLHALTIPQDPEVLAANSRSAFAQILASGVDPDRSIVFLQSQVPEHAQLAWLLMCQTGFGEASRMTQFKDKSAKTGAGAASVGLFTYPVLQAADILLYQATQVPVGDDQRQHLELTRDLAQRFNARYAPVFTVPEATVPKTSARISDLAQPESKMSKSNPPGCVYLLDDPKKITKRIKSAVTDGVGKVQYSPEEQPGLANLIDILATLSGRSTDDVVAEFAGEMYGPLKGAVAEAVVAVAEPFAARTRELLDDPAELTRLMDAGAERAHKIARGTLNDAYRAVGLPEPL